MADICPLCETGGAPVVFSTRAQMFWVVADRDLTDRFQDVSLRQCRACGHIFNTDIAPDTIAEIYRRQTATNRPVSEAMVQRYQTLLHFLGRERLVGKRILEVGGGTGSLARLLAELGADVTVVEPNDELPDLLADAAGTIRVVNDFFGPDTLDETFDGVICRQVVEHILDVRPFVRALGAAVAPGGFAYMEVPTLEYIAKAGAYMEIHVQHLHYMDAAARARLMADAGLEIVGTHDILNGHDVGVLAVPSSVDAAAGAAGRTSIDLVNARRDAHQAFVHGFAGDPARTAVYAATSQGVTFYNLFESGAAPARFVDDNPDYVGRYAYGRGGVADIYSRSEALLASLDDIFIGAYHHEPAISEKLRQDGFAGTVWSTHPGHPTIERISK
ncbi:MAG: class I SAM-dependent methyltransferase [Thalassobaculaceae bacterium]|nr:class I SAM-dependent methyltransferase [Thalassobaculaceae bacterium]